MDPDGNQRHFLNSSRNSCAVSVLRAETRAATQACREAEGGGGGDSPCSLAASSEAAAALMALSSLGSSRRPRPWLKKATRKRKGKRRRRLDSTVAQQSDESRKGRRPAPPRRFLGFRHHAGAQLLARAQTPKRGRRLLGRARESNCRNQICSSSHRVKGYVQVKPACDLFHIAQHLSCPKP